MNQERVIMKREILTVDQLAERMQVRRRTILGWVKNGMIPVIRPTPKVLRFDPDAVIQALTIPSNVEAT